MSKYELTNETNVCDGIILHRIKTLKDFNNVKAGDIEGWVEKEDNLSQEDNCLVYGNAIVCGNAEVFSNAYISGDARISGNAIICGNTRVFDNARVCDNARIYDNAIVCDDARISGNAEVYGNARISGNAYISGNARVCGNARIGNNAYISYTSDYICIGPIGSRLDYTTFYLDKNKNIYVCCGCYNGTIDEFKDRVLEVHKDNEYAKQYLSSIDYVLSMIGGRI